MADVERDSVDLQYLSREGRGQMAALKQRIAEMDGVTRLLFAAQQLAKFERIARDSRDQAERSDGGIVRGTMGRSNMRRLALATVAFGILALAAVPAQAAELIVPLITGALTAAGVTGSVAIFGITVGVAPLLAGLVTTPIGRGLSFRGRR